MLTFAALADPTGLAAFAFAFAPTTMEEEGTAVGEEVVLLGAGTGTAGTAGAAVALPWLWPACTLLPTGSRAGIRTRVDDALASRLLQ